jgi:hypothetical protein
VDRGVYEITVSIDIGLFKCYSDVCDKYEKSDVFLKLPPIPFPAKPIGLPTEPPAQIRASSSPPSTDYPFSKPPSSAVVVQTLSPYSQPDVPKIPPSARDPSRLTPTIENIPVMSPVLSPVFSPGTAPPIHVPDNKHDKILLEAAEKPFYDASGYVVSLLVLNALLCGFSICISLYHFCQEGIIRFNGQLLLLIAAMCVNSLAVAVYIIMTIFYLNGGYYIDGVWITALMSITGLLCILVSFAADVEIKNNSYTRIPEVQLQNVSHHSPHTGGGSVVATSTTAGTNVAGGVASVSDSLLEHRPQPYYK